MNDRDVQAVLAVLANEQEALRQGAFDQISQLAPQKDAFAAALKDMRLSRDQAEKLRLEADKTARMLKAALSGVKDAQARLAALQSTRDGLSIYTAGGARETVAPQSRGLEHKV